MANLTYPGVYVQEISSGVRPIQAAGTSVAAFIGVAEKGPINKAVKVYNFTEYQNLYGGFLNNSYLSHAVLQFFNNGGTQCYIIRVAGANTQTANIVLYDRGSSPDESLTISAVSPGFWGNSLAVVITNGTRDPGNEFNLSVYWQDDEQTFTLMEKFEDLSMVPDAPNFADTVIAASKYIRVNVNQGNSNVTNGISRGALAPQSLAGTQRTRMRINVDGDGYQEVDLQAAVPDTVDNLATAANIALAIQDVVRKLNKIRFSTDQDAFDEFTCTVDAGTGVLVLKSGTESFSSSVNIAPASSSDFNATGYLSLGKLEGGAETLGGQVTRPRVTPVDAQNNPIHSLVGDNAYPTTEVESVQAGSDGDSITTDTPYTDAFDFLNNIEDVSLIAVPGIGSAAVVGAGMNYCANRSLSDCFFIGDMAVDDNSVLLAQTFWANITTKNSYGAVYIPWILMLDPTGASAEPIPVPPSGFVAGLYSKTDAQRGVWKAPAGTAVSLGGSVGLTVNFSDVQQGNLNPININVIRQFAASGIVIWGARTISSDPEWKYIPVRRMAIFLRVSIYRGIQWAVFEPNDESLWSQLRLNIGSFMMNLFRQGAFQGSSPSQAFFVKCDSETTTQIDIDNGVVNILVGFAPLKPAEFVVVKISQKAGKSL